MSTALTVPGEQATIHPLDTLQEAWHWRAWFRDGSSLDEYPPDEPETHHAFSAIHLDELVALELVPQRPGLPTPHVRVDADGMRPIFFRRREVLFCMATGSTTHEQTVHCLGWARTVKGVSVKSFTFFFEDGSLVISDDAEAV